MKRYSYVLYIALFPSLLSVPIGALGLDSGSPSSSYENILGKKDPTGLAIHDRVLFKVDEENVVTTLDVIQKLNILFYTSYPHLIDSYPARSQYYSAMWPVVLESILDEFLMYADAKEKKLDVDPTTVNQEIEEILGRDLTPFYSHFDMTPEDIVKVIERTLTAQRVMGMMVRSKAMLKVTPGKIKEAYDKLAREAEKRFVWKYRVLTIKAATESLASSIAEKVSTRLNETKCWDKERLLSLVLSQGGQFTCSDEFCRNDDELSESHKQELLEVAYPEKWCGLPKASKSGYKLFVLVDKSVGSVAPLEELEAQIKQRLFASAAVELEKQYKEKLRARYGFDASIIAKLLSEEAPPLFSLL